jgi:beta-mannosidase
MSGSLCLNGIWQLGYAEDSARMTPGHYTARETSGRRFWPAPVPAPIHQVLTNIGMLGDVNVGINTLTARWVEEQFWVYRRTLTVPDAATRERAWLDFAHLELEAVIWLNGEEIGRHANAHRPARFEVTGKLQAGDNLLVVRLESGLHAAADKQGAGYCSGGIGLLTKRHWHRHPQYQSGWDWHPRLVNIGILGDVHLTWSAVPRLEQVTVFAHPSPDLTSAAMVVRASVEAAAETPVILRARIVDTGQVVELPLTVPAGETRHELQLTIDQPQLWWPRGHGEQFRYTVEVTLEAEGEAQVATRKTGVRRVHMDQSPHPETGRYCILTINNRPIFCKGGNWVPADIYYSAVPAERYRALVDLAVQANFNLLRIWGGGAFADHALCEACDEAGVLIWHDFLFACAQYPGHVPEFAAEVQREITYAVRAWAHHPSLVVWCGNNEIEWGDWNWGYDGQTPAHPHYVLFHRDIPRIVAQEDPSTVHWISSPWSPDFQQPNEPTVGDQHPWTVSMEAGGADWWKYRANVDRFPNEGGVIGASSPATLRQFLPPHEQHLLSHSWEHHDNPFACEDAVPGGLGHAYQTVELWTGRDPLAMELEEYAFVSGLLHAEGLREYIDNYRRRMFSSASAIFWMYNDSWPATHSWTIVDYYLRKKLAYHPVRRAFAPITVVVADDGETVGIYGVNDTPQAWQGQVRFGLFTLAGDYAQDTTGAVTLAANASTLLGTIAKSDWDALGVMRSGAFAVFNGEGVHAQHRLFLARFKELEFVEPQITLTHADGVLSLVSPTFVWGVCLDLDGERSVADNSFDLLPGVPYQLPWAEELGAPQVLRIGSRDAVSVPSAVG